MATPEADVAGTTNSSAAEQPVQSIEQDADGKSRENKNSNGNKGDGSANPGDAAPSATGTATPTTAGPAQPAVNEVTPDQWRSMMDVVMAIYEFREEDNYDPSRLFHRSVNKRYVPDYYDIIKEPMALSILKQKINKREYTKFEQFVRDCALITHNAQTYNRPESQAYRDALVIKDVFIGEFKKLVDSGIITAEQAEMPDLGEIPEADPLPAEDEEDEDDDDEDDEDEDSDDGDGRRRRRRGPRKKDDSQHQDQEVRKKRGRPPRVDTPMEARIKAVLKGLRKFKDNTGQLKVRHFERLPDKAMYPDYFMEIREPMAIDSIKRKSKRKKYNSVDHFMRDVDLMFNNAKSYNEPNSQIYKDAEDLQVEAHKLAEQEKRKPDSEYLMEDGRLPLPQGIVHNGELWKVGDWVHIQNPNDVTKPIVAQIYRTWQDSEGEKWVNACWYYRPEQTVHHFEKHFYPNEVVKTGQYRDHRIDEVIDRCFVMFFTRYNRGRPRGFPLDKEIYVCEARYNEEKHKLNKIKTWASCLPDEVREKDYEMDLYDVPRRIKKIPSPIKHLLPPNAKETDDVPKPTWGAEKAPPLVGAVHRRPRDENESPPPEPTPSPPPQPMHRPSLPASLPQQPSLPLPISRAPLQDSMSQSPMGTVGNIAPVRSPAVGAPLAMGNMPNVPVQPYQAQVPSPAPYYQPLQARAASYATPSAHPSTYQPTPVQQPVAAQPSPQAYTQASPYTANRYPAPTAAAPAPAAPVYNPNAPRPVEVFHLSDTANAAIPTEVRSQFHCDDHGRVLFFSTPPMDIVASTSTKKPLGHSLKYLAAKAAKEEKRKRRLEEEQQQQPVTKQARITLVPEKETLDPSRLKNLISKTVSLLTQNITTGTEELYNSLYGNKKSEYQAADQRQLDHRVKTYTLMKQAATQLRTQTVNELAPKETDFRRGGVYLEDIN
ncbi:RSC complex subunit (RSC1), putative [Talaromyces stipitatus ATCC 10500]|uniref:RSC complex subunit (RSC1), putative n=1 Tax=Talaromyces stipitatus (strain ATCC 10500 / CBS 375.48 / QM 6759 / NRRL 1006) TaxID=441959 RepID=B8MNQ2_TALSN|nr:RSC complex subunit (RSC1), putative [Talaromyces stipitatus ATCC 10500]EED14141.1 RSC complex subunit (RSC1), putative [Talaromyces stipitatus ATCC 10500]